MYDLKGDSIKENTPFTFPFKKHSLVLEGKPVEYQTIIYCDRTDRPAVIYKDQEVEELDEAGKMENVKITYDMFI